ncbi:MAG: hypothetical protein ACKVK0_07050 [Pirellulales bacterium]
MRRTLTISNYTTAVIACITVSFCSRLTTAAQEVAITDSITTYLGSHCSACHNADQDSAGVDFSKLSVLKSENSQL